METLPCRTLVRGPCRGRAGPGTGTGIMHDADARPMIRDMIAEHIRRGFVGCAAGIRPAQ